jgi:erythromycin esterase
VWQYGKVNPKLRWLEDNLIPVRSIDPNDEDFSDLEPLKKVFGKARVVMLGEQTHGDGATFLAKTRLVKFLHQQMGFDVLAFESGLYDCHLAWQRIVARDKPDGAIRKALFRVWANSAQAQPLMDYVVQTAYSEEPLQLVGFDMQFSNDLSRENIWSDLRRLGIEPPSGDVRDCLKGLLE